MITAKIVRAYLSYNSHSGVLRWKKVASNRAPAGSRADYFHTGTGYVYVGLFGRSYKAHRLIWLIQTGHWPKADIDHINGHRYDNRWMNLREASRSQNAANGKRRAGISGYKGVSLHHKSGKWRARLKVQYREINLGLFDDARAAHAAYVTAAKKHFGEFARAR